MNLRASFFLAIALHLFRRDLEREIEALAQQEDKGKQPSSEELAELARSLSLSEKKLLEICDRVLNE